MFVFVFSLMGISGSYSEDLFCRQTQCKFYGNYPTWNSNPFLVGGYTPGGGAGGSGIPGTIGT